MREAERASRSARALSCSRGRHDCFLVTALAPSQISLTQSSELNDFPKVQREREREKEIRVSY